jgi:hypothetical protein
MPTLTVTPKQARDLDIRCNVTDVVLSNIANHLVFFVPRRLDTTALMDAFGQALTSLPVYAGRLTLRRGAVHICCRGQGVPFTSARSGHTLDQAIRAATTDNGHWLVDPVNGAVARWGLGPLCTVRITHLIDGATAIGVSFHHAVGDMASLMLLMKAWAAALAGEPAGVPVLVEDRAAYLDAHLPAGGATDPGVRCLGHVEAVRSLMQLAVNGRRLKTLTLYFGDDEITRLRDASDSRMSLSVNDLVCGHVCEALMTVDPAVRKRVLAVPVDLRRRCGLDPMLVGNMLAALNVDMRRRETARSIAESIRHGIDGFEEHCDTRVNQEFFDAVGPWRGARCVAVGFDPAQWNPLITNVTGFGVHRLCFGGVAVTYCAVLSVPVAGHGVIIEGLDGRGLVVRITLPPRDFDALSSPEIRERLHRFRRADDDIPQLHREVRV